MDFNEFEWHDAIIKNIQIDRNNPGINDDIMFDIIWPDDQNSTLIFKDVYWAKMILGFGVVADESIYEAFVCNNDLDMINLLAKWKGVITENEVCCYIIKTGSTASEIKIIAKSFKVTINKIVDV